MIPRVDLEALDAGDPAALAQMRRGAEDVGFVTLHNTGIAQAQVAELIEAYRAFFALPQGEKARVDMAKTGSNRGWGASRSEQVNRDANPDYKEVFDAGFELPEDDPIAQLGLLIYAPNQWPAQPSGFAQTVRAYYGDACREARRVLRGVARATGLDGAFFDDKFTRPMALLRGNYYPERPKDAGDADFGIATHTDYGCLTFLAGDGTPGLEVRNRGGGWSAVAPPMGEFVINFGEMMQIWSEGKIVATPHRVVGTTSERISVPLFFNPNHDTNIAPQGARAGAGEVIEAGAYLTRRYDETYVHLQAK